MRQYSLGQYLGTPIHSPDINPETLGLGRLHVEVQDGDIVVALPDQASASEAEHQIDVGGPEVEPLSPRLDCRQPQGARLS